MNPLKNIWLRNRIRVHTKYVCRQLITKNQLITTHFFITYLEFLNAPLQLI